MVLFIAKKPAFSALRRQNQWAMGSATDKQRSSASLESLKGRVFQVAPHCNLAKKRQLTVPTRPAGSAGYAKTTVKQTNQVASNLNIAEDRP
ncbi:hypothetical protein [Lactiplantibacillus paraxiangfangensis]|uniref:hypothetical protein n=1 Tax=Lactiplantibacillus paraxiangfangensis TaxID=3076224 RepID=UPI0030C6AB5E